ncbi:hypothetical protein ACH4F6_37970 [Streptomyces sp. NPDC017936]|uniref:hypothetical protein n=1 Tax=Streptomyces sp. NPDC017936 TaxID=3365016 RepID=UPI0037BD2E52
MTTADRIADPGFIAAMDQIEAATSELIGLGVPYDRAVATVQSVYSAGLDRGLHLGLRDADTPPAV